MREVGPQRSSIAAASFGFGGKPLDAVPQVIKIS